MTSRQLSHNEYTRQEKKKTELLKHTLLYTFRPECSVKWIHVSLTLKLRLIVFSD